MREKGGRGAIWSFYLPPPPPGWVEPTVAFAETVMTSHKVHAGLSRGGEERGRGEEVAFPLLLLLHIPAVMFSIPRAWDAPPEETEFHPAETLSQKRIIFISQTCRISPLAVLLG